MTMEIMAISESSAFSAFNNFPHMVYRNTFKAPDFPLPAHSGQFMDPLFSRVIAQPLLAVEGGRPVGRIAACINQAYPEKNTGFFGYFESLNNPAAAAALVQAAKHWLADHGLSQMIGPVDLTPHERLGILVNGFQGHHLPGMPYNPSYYNNLLTRCGLTKEINLYAYHYNLKQPLPEKLLRVANRALSRIKQFAIREINYNDLTREGEVFSQIHNGSMDDGWGFVPLAGAEGTAIWQKLSGRCAPELLLVAEVNGEPAGICLAILPIFKSSISGRLVSRSILRLAVLAVLPQYRKRGIEAALIHECIRRARSQGASVMELSQIAENNNMMNHIIQSLGNIQCDRTYTIYRDTTNAQ